MIALPLFIVGLYAYFELRWTSEQHSRTRIESHINQSIEDYHFKVSSARFALQSIANDSLLKNYLLTENEFDRFSLMQKPMLTRLASIQAANSNFYEIRLIMPDGFEELRVVNRDIVNVRELETETERFNQLSTMTENYHEMISVNPDTGNLALYISLPLMVRDRAREKFTELPRLRGYLSITQDISELVAPQLPYPWESGVQLLSVKNIIMLRPQNHSELTNRLATSGQLKDLTVNQWESTTIGSDKLMYYSQSLSEDMTLYAFLPERALVKQSIKVSIFVIALAGVVLLIFVPLMLILLHKNLVIPIARLNNAIKTLGKKNKRIELKNKTGDEIGDLYDAFNKMSADLHRSGEKIRHLAFVDTLTGLPNRFMFRRNLNRAVEVAKREDRLLALLYLDLDNFKYVNDNMGHPVGDILLLKIAEKLRRSLRIEDMASRVNPTDPLDNFSRLGGDEFTIMIPHLTGPHQASMIAKRILDEISKPIDLGGNHIYASASIGIALWPNDTLDKEELITYADQAMYQAKNNGKNQYAFFSPTLGKQTSERSTIEQRLFHAIEKGGFYLVYQPIVDSQKYQIQSFEALIRWEDEVLGHISPDRFISIAEENGSIVKIGEWALEEVCAQIVRWKNEGYDNIRVAVNLSAQQICGNDIVATVQNTLDKYNLTPEHLYLELTETSVIQGEKQALKNLVRLRRLGIQVALDDFGTGYSSLGYLRKLPIDILKIDRTFIKDIAEKNNSALLSAIIEMARALNLRVVTEGVEEQEQLSYLPQAPDVMIQGYLFSRPLAPELVIKQLQLQQTMNMQISTKDRR